MVLVSAGRYFFRACTSLVRQSIVVRMGEAQGLTDKEAKELLKLPDAETKDFLFQQTMYRIKDPRASIPFYNEVLGMSLLCKMDFPEAQFSLYFMGYEDIANQPSDRKECIQWAMSRKATLELTHNWGTEADPDQKYHNFFEDQYGFKRKSNLKPVIGRWNIQVADPVYVLLMNFHIIYLSQRQ
ncbi:lactoylglutathione lyase isoform X2 [Malaya genurostris]|uniref:lactoylglutathione lyase isoform X2 n=1 Tax=Malaya genurostris TaxID=325434 RepID=UPI0026F3FC27|nr:lactoylglutathione lyase isoform X2 [Malaya genurostris]